MADSMRRQGGLVARRIKRRNGLTRQDKTAPKFPDLLKRNFTADRPNARWVGDMTEIPTVDEHGRPGPKLYLATVIDLYSRRLLGAATSLHPDAQLACSATKMAVAARGSVDAVNGPGWRQDESQRVVFHTDRGSTSITFTDHLADEGIKPSIGTVGDAYDTPMECVIGLYKTECVRTTVFHSGPYRTIGDVEFATAGWVDWYTNRRLHGSLGMMTPVDFARASTRIESAENLGRFTLRRLSRPHGMVVGRTSGRTPGSPSS